MLSPCRYLQADQFADARLLKPYPSCGDWDNRYIGVLAAIAATPAKTQCLSALRNRGNSSSVSSSPADNLISDWRGGLHARCRSEVIAAMQFMTAKKGGPAPGQREPRL
jgi:hypothetical protein